MAAPTVSAASAASIAAADEERRTRIITHMNGNHVDELIHYLRYYSSIPSAAASSPRLCDITLQGMRIRAHGVDYAIPFSPPLQSWDDSRTRFVQMDSKARAALGLSDIYVREWAAPRGFDCVVFAAVGFYFCSVASLPWIVPGWPLWRLLATIFPGGPEWFRWIVKAIFLPVISIHLVEAYLFDKKRMYRHGIARWSGLWWAWEASCFLEGVTAWRRIDALIGRKRIEKEVSKKKN